MTARSGIAAISHWLSAERELGRSMGLQDAAKLIARAADYYGESSDIRRVLDLLRESAAVAAIEATDRALAHNEAARLAREPQGDM
jgi:hypothetical protein